MLAAAFPRGSAGLAVLAASALLAGCASAPPVRTAPAGAEPPPVVSVRIDPNVETTGILLALAFESYRFGEFTLPVAYDAQARLAAFRQHPAVVATRTLVPQLGIDNFTQMAVRAQPFGGPMAGTMRAPLLSGWLRAAGAGDEAAGRARLEEYLRQVADFHRAADVGGFLAWHRAGYARAEEEVRRLAPDPALIAAMEGWFGERLRSYVIIPTLTHPPYGNVGGAIEVDADAGLERDAFFVMGTNVSVADSSFAAGRAGGFHDPAAPEKSRREVADLVLHEFGHAFINPHLGRDSALAAEIGRHEALFARLRVRMAPQAYAQWYAVAVEHVTRLTEIRVALAAGDTARASRLRRQYGDERAFVYIPWLERSVEAFEAEGPRGTGRYPTFGAFLPRLLGAFAEVDTAAAYAGLQAGTGPLRRVTVRVRATVPAGDTVFLAGSHRALGPWDPRGLPLARGGDGAWTGTVEVEEGTRLAMVVTRGAWRTEAGRPERPDPATFVSVRSDTAVAIDVAGWIDRD